jgi:hypothetical protein
MILYRIFIHADTDADADAAATGTQPLTSLTYQPDIPQDTTSHYITSHHMLLLH